MAASTNAKPAQECPRQNKLARFKAQIRHSEVVPSIPGTYRPVGIALAVLGCGLAIHGFVRLYSIHIAATAAVFNLEVSSGALLVIVGAIFLARKGGGASNPVSDDWGHVSGTITVLN
jgi:hypothetical protein